MRILLIDDMPETKGVKASLNVLNYADGINALEKLGPWDILYLDHDLGLGKTGYDVMCWLEEHPKFLPGHIICVSRNPVGRKNIQVVIDKLYGGKNG